MKLLYSVLFLFGFGLSAPTLAAWDLNDVSYLMPLPKKVATDSLLSLKSSARGGFLLREALVQRLPILSPQLTREQAAASLRVMAVRIDPCFPLPTPQSCQKQIRLVWQPLESDRRNQVKTIDAALHSFYVLTDAEFATLLKDLEEWKKTYAINTNFVPLQIHPAWAADGDSSPALAEFHKIITKLAGLENLSRVTVMVLRGAGDMWAFAGFEMKDGKMELMRIPRIDRMSQAFINLAVPSDHFTGGGILPLPTGADTLSTITNESEHLDVNSEDTIRKEIKAAYRIENPKNHTPENMDCVSCHVAQPAIHWALNKQAHLKLDQLWSHEIYKNPKYDLTNVSPDLLNTQIIRGFGYFGRNMAISQRVINESAEVADQLNQGTAVKTQPPLR
ncbi:MAG: hypothetical protein HUU57_01820 [Bdellovibrio sp.]|nr:hypothetical protein [Bdellovibrio sp.]